MNAAAWRASLRIARREAWRAKGRSLLVIALIGLPVLVLAGADITYRTWQLDPVEKINRSIGSADASVGWYSHGPVQQTPNWPDGGYEIPQADTKPVPVPPTSELLANLPPGSRAIERHRVSSTIDTEAGKKYATVNGLDYSDPIARGLVHQVRGRAPRTSSEIALTRSLAHNGGFHLGDMVRSSDPDQSFRLVGIVSDASHRRANEAYTLPSAFPVATFSNGFNTDDFSWLVDTPSPVSWQQVLGLNKLGYLARSRYVVLHPPPRSQVPYHDASSPAISATVFATGTLIGGMALLEIVLLAGPAFAASARRQRRELALVAAVGGRRFDLRNIVLSKGIVLGVAGGVLSVAGAVALTAIGIASFGRYVDGVPGHFDVRPVELLALTLVSLVTALAAAVFPARGAARTDVVAALAGRRGTMRTRKRVPVLGVLVAVAGVLVALSATGASASANIILAGVALTEIGLIICTPALVGLVARTARWLPLSPRIALRDAGRNRSSAAPAVAAVMAAVIGSMALAISVTSSNDQDRRAYRPQMPMSNAFAYLGQDARSASQAAAALQATMPGSHAITVNTMDNDCDQITNGQTCPSTDISPAPPATWSYRGGFLPPVTIDDGSGVGTLLSTDDPAPATALRAGKAVVTAPAMIHNGRASLHIARVKADGSASDSDITVPAVLADEPDAFVSVIIPPSLADRIDVRWSAYAVYVDTAHRPTEREQQAAAGALGKISAGLQMYVETGYHNSGLWMLIALIVAAGVITIGATTIATALSNVDSRPDLTTLGAVGAAPRTRRLLSMSRAGVIAGIGTALGAVAGFLPPYAWVHSQARSAELSGGTRGGTIYVPGEHLPRMLLVVPWLPLTATLIVVPLAAMLVAGLFSRSRLPSERPAD